MRTALFWAFTQRVLIITDVSDNLTLRSSSVKNPRYLTLEDWTSFSQFCSCISVPLVVMSSSLCIFNLYTYYVHMYVLN